MLFELAMATRVRRVRGTKQNVTLNAEDANSVGDFSISGDGYRIPCECSRLGHSPQITHPKVLQEALVHRINEGAKRVAVPLCVKIKSTAALNGTTYNVVLGLIRRCLADARQANLPCEHVGGSTSVRIEVLDEQSEEICSQNVERMIVNVSEADWDLATSICRAPTKDPNELPDRLAAGERFRDYEGVRLFMKFGEAEDKINSKTKEET